MVSEHNENAMNKNNGTFVLLQVLYFYQIFLMLQSSIKHFIAPNQFFSFRTILISLTILQVIVIRLLS